MMLIEIAHPAGRLDDHDRELAGRAITDLFLGVDGAPHGHAVETIRRARTATHIAFRELQGWRTGDGPVAPDAAPPLIITLTVPEAWCREGGARTFIGLLRTAVRRLDDHHGWKRPRGSLWVRVDGVPDGSIGLDGYPATGDDVLAFLTEEFQAARENGTAAPVPEGRLPDPICGMTVSDGKGSLVMEDGGERLGFCSQGCQDAYVKGHPEAVVV